MMEINFIALELVLELHDAMIHLYDGSFGVRDQRLLESALFQPQVMFGGSFIHQDIYTMAAVYLFHLIKNHSFIDGNKRTAVATTLMFLRLNNCSVNLGHQQLYQLAIDIAESKLSKEAIADFLRKNVLES